MRLRRSTRDIFDGNRIKIEGDTGSNRNRKHGRGGDNHQERPSGSLNEAGPRKRILLEGGREAAWQRQRDCIRGEVYGG